VVAEDVWWDDRFFAPGGVFEDVEECPAYNPSTSGSITRHDDQGEMVPPNIRPRRIEVIDEMKRKLPQ
jgi:hypothetical protein